MSAADQTVTFETLVWRISVNMHLSQQVLEPQGNC